MNLRLFAKFIPAIILSMSIILLWELCVRILNINPVIIPAPSNIFIALTQNWSIIALHTWQTFLETIIGFILSIFFGIIGALLLDKNTWVRQAVYPMLITSQTIPVIAFAPLLLIWFGFGILPKIIIVVLGCFFPITIAFADGLAQTDKDILKMLKSMNANYWQILRFIKIPAALPQFFSGLKIAATYSVTSAIIGEYVGAYQGLGIYMQEISHAHITALVFAIILATTILSLLFFGVVILIEKLCLPWIHNS